MTSNTFHFDLKTQSLWARGRAEKFPMLDALGDSRFVVVYQLPSGSRVVVKSDFPKDKHSYRYQRQTLTECLLYPTIAPGDKRYFPKLLELHLSEDPESPSWHVSKFYQKDSDFPPLMSDRLLEVLDKYDIIDVEDRDGDNWFTASGRPIIVDFGLLIKEHPIYKGIPFEA